MRIHYRKEYVEYFLVVAIGIDSLRWFVRVHGRFILGAQLERGRRAEHLLQNPAVRGEGFWIFDSGCVLRNDFYFSLRVLSLPRAPSNWSMARQGSVYGR